MVVIYIFLVLCKIEVLYAIVLSQTVRRKVCKFILCYKSAFEYFDWSMWLVN